MRRARQVRVSGQPTIHIINRQRRFPIDRAAVKALITRVLEGECCGKECRLSVCFVADAAMQRLNARFHHRDEPTDVVAFVLSSDKAMLFADIVVSTDTACRQARRYRSTAERETRLYVVHGLLHLLGYNDHTRRQRSCMQRVQRKYL